MRKILMFAAVLMGLITLSFSDASPAWAASKKSGLTCTTIRKQCFKGCQKEAPRQFCLGYCLDKKHECLKTGNWLGIRRTFRNVIRR